MKVDYFVQVIYKIQLPMILNRNIVCDRYIYDTIITDIAVDVGYSEYDMLGQIEKWLSILPIPDVVFLIDLPEEIAYNRKNDVPAIEYLQDRRGHYLSAGDKFKMVIIDGTERIEDSPVRHKKIMVVVP